MKSEAQKRALRAKAAAARRAMRTAKPTSAQISAALGPAPEYLRELVLRAVSPRERFCPRGHFDCRTPFTCSLPYADRF